MADDDDLRGLREIGDPLERARRANLAIPQLARIRKDAIAEASLIGSQAAIAKTLGVTPQAISRILIAGPGAAPERGFWGADGTLLTVAVGGKPEGPKDASGPPGRVVAEEDFAAFDMIKDSVAALGITAVREVIPPPGFVNLTRAGLVVICGPRLSPMVGQVLASDQVLGFGRDGGGWYLEDRRAGTSWRSPIDSGESADIAYLGRLPRLDGRGTFLYVGGIHAAGAPGVIHYIDANLAGLWAEVRDRRFSVLIRSRFDPETRAVISSEPVTDIYQGG